MATYVIGEFTFPTKAAAREAVRQVLHRTPLETPLVGADFAFIRALVDCHPLAEEKVGPGVRQIEVRAIEFGAPGFWLHRTDGTAVDFSYRKALDGAPNRRQAVRAALRWEIQDQVDAVRGAAFSDGSPLTCPLTGLLLQPTSRIHVDHSSPTFAELADVFVVGMGGYEQIEVEAAKVGGRSRLRDHNLAVAWQEFHRQFARLRVVHPSANLARHQRAAS